MQHCIWLVLRKCLFTGQTQTEQPQQDGSGKRRAERRLLERQKTYFVDITVMQEILFSFFSYLFTNWKKYLSHLTTNDFSLLRKSPVDFFSVGGRNTKVAMETVRTRGCTWQHPNIWSDITPCSLKIQTFLYLYSHEQTFKLHEMSLMSAQWKYWTKKNQQIIISSSESAS